jgi:L-threonylcarbamoyladenylate synthase
MKRYSKVQMYTISIGKENVDEAVSAVLRVLRNGGIAAYPTESFYALGVNALNEAAVQKLYRLKNRPGEKAMPVIIGSLDVLRDIVKTTPFRAVKLMETFWPGALTLIFQACRNVPAMLCGFTKKIAVRIPGDSFALRLARASDFPVTATSANISGMPPSQSVEEIVRYFEKDIDVIVDQGKAPGGKPSTIVDVTVDPPNIVREGSVPSDRVQSSY